MSANQKYILSFRNVIVLLLPAIIYSVFFVVRILGMQPPTDAGMGDFITVVYLIFGSSITYVMFVLRSLKMLPANGSEEKWWWLFSSLFLLYLSYDEVYMIHENIAEKLQIWDVFIFLTYAAIMLTLVFLHRHKITPLFKFFLGGFILLAGTSVFTDTVFGEGYISILGREIDIEQISESLGALSLSCAFASAAVREVLQYITKGSIAPDLSPLQAASEADPATPIEKK
ncbi:MAG: hypothetical protein AB1746_09780 [Candidatus Zixiibacteriota bacterium]